MRSEGFPGVSVVRNLPADAGDANLISGLGRSPGEGNGTLLQYSCLENPMVRGAWWAAVHGVTNSQTWLRLNDNSNEILTWTCINNSGYLSHLKVLNLKHIYFFPCKVIYLHIYKFWHQDVVILESLFLPITTVNPVRKMRQWFEQGPHKWGYPNSYLMCKKWIILFSDKENAN